MRSIRRPGRRSWPRKAGSSQLADRAWRPRLEPDAEVHLRDGDVAFGLPAQLVDGRAHVRAGHHEVRHGRAEEEVPAADPQLGRLVVPGLFRAGLGLDLRQPLDERPARGRSSTSSMARRPGRLTPSGPHWIFCLVRTSKEDKKQNGISFILVDMKSPGITHHADQHAGRHADRASRRSTRSSSTT